MRSAKLTSMFAIALAVVLGLGAGAIHPAHAQSFTLLHTFAGAPDGAYPAARLVQGRGGQPLRQHRHGRDHRWRMHGTPRLLCRNSLGSGSQRFKRGRSPR